MDELTRNTYYVVAGICVFIVVLVIGKRTRQSAGSNAAAMARVRWFRCCTMILTILGLSYTSWLLVDHISGNASNAFRPGSSVVKTDLDACFVCKSRIATQSVLYKGRVMYSCGMCEPPSTISNYTNQPKYRRFVPGTGAVRLPTRIVISVIASFLTVSCSWFIAEFVTRDMETKLATVQTLAILFVLSGIFVTCVFVYNSTLYHYLGSPAA